MLAWSPADQLAAVTSVQNEREACPGCGLRHDQMTLVEADVERCPGCEAREREAKRASDSVGLRTRFYPVADTRQSVWARYTADGKRWLRKVRRDPDPILLRSPDDADN